jgi:RND family efflux transporter MFP subunit
MEQTTGTAGDRAAAGAGFPSHGPSTLARGAAAAFLLLLSASLPLAGCGGKEKGKEGAGAPPPLVQGVKVEKVSSVERPSLEEALGQVKARTAAAVSPQVMGRIASIPVSVGSTVRKGELLASVDDAQGRAQLAAAEGAVAEATAAKEEVERAVAQAEASRALAGKTLERYRKLLADRVVTQQEFDEVETRKVLADREQERVSEKRSQVASRIDQAKAREREARTALGWYRVTAPFAGIVTEKRGEPGALAVPGQPLLVLEDPSRYRFEASVAETFLPLLKKGSVVTVLLDSEPGKERGGSISEVVPVVEPGSRTFLVKADLSGGTFRGGMSGRMRFAAGKRKVLSVPEVAVVRTGGYEALFVVSPEGTARLVMVKTGALVDGRREILSGVEEGASVAVSAVDRLSDGARVEVAR